MEFKINKKCRITSEFSDNSSYRPWVHTGIDWTCGYGRIFTFDNPGYIYKQFDVETPGSDGWRGIYQLCEYNDEFGSTHMEVCMGHNKESFVSVGDNVKSEQKAGIEGNFGLVFSGGIQITPEMRKSGDKRGSHVHEHYRPVKKVKELTPGKHYLRTNRGVKYKDSDGYYYEITFTNEAKGCINPRAFTTDPDVAAARIVMKNYKPELKSVWLKLWNKLLKKY